MSDFFILMLLGATVYLCHGYDIVIWWEDRKAHRPKGRKPTKAEIEELMREVDAL